MAVWGVKDGGRMCLSCSGVAVSQGATFILNGPLCLFVWASVGCGLITHRDSRSTLQTR